MALLLGVEFAPHQGWTQAPVQERNTPNSVTVSTRPVDDPNYIGPDSWHRYFTLSRNKPKLDRWYATTQPASAGSYSASHRRNRSTESVKTDAGTSQQKRTAASVGSGKYDHLFPENMTTF